MVRLRFVARLLRQHHVFLLQWTHVGVVTVLRTVETQHSLVAQMLHYLSEQCFFDLYILAVGRLVTLHSAIVADRGFTPVPKQKSARQNLLSFVIILHRKVGKLAKTGLLFQDD